jgi:MFS-type transporter involved in bile tolerance (Atg22 family)
MKDQFSKLIGNSNYMLFLIGTALVCSQGAVFLTCLTLIVKPYDPSSTDSGILGFVQQIAGVPGCIIASIVLFGHR